jgi:hypothetical protein
MTYIWMQRFDSSSIKFKKRSLSQKINFFQSWLLQISWTEVQRVFIFNKKFHFIFFLLARSDFTYRLSNLFFFEIMNKPLQATSVLTTFHMLFMYLLLLFLINYSCLYLIDKWNVFISLGFKYFLESLYLVIYIVHLGWRFILNLHLRLNFFYDIV